MQLTFSKVEENLFKFRVVTADYGLLEWTELYHDEGMTKTIEGRNGAGITEEWSRIFPFEGWYAMEKAEGMKEYGMALGE